MVWNVHKPTRQGIEMEINEIKSWLKTRADTGDAEAIMDFLKYWDEKQKRLNELEELRQALK